MASFSAEFTVDGKSFPLITASYGLYQATDDSGKPRSGVRTHLIQVQVIGSDDETLPDWAVDPQKRLDGKLTFARIDESSTFKEITFEQAYCVQYIERVAPADVSDSTLAGAYLIDIGISPAVVNIGNTKHDNQWR